MRPFLDDAKRRVDQRLSASRQSISTSRMFSSAFPERLKDDQDDAQIDYTAPPGGSRSRDGLQYMGQSMLSLIAAVGTRSDFRARFDDSSDSDGEGETDTRQVSRSQGANSPQSDATLQVPPSPGDRSSSQDRGRRHRRSISDHRLFQPFKTGTKKDKERETTAPPPQPSTNERLSPFPALPSLPRPRSATPRAAPILSRMLEARARLESEDMESSEASQEGKNDSIAPQSEASPLSLRLMEMFGFSTPEKIIVEYACSLLQSMLLQGYMYVTEKHICFYAYLPRKSTVVSKTGWIHKRGKKNPKYNRYWFELKGDVLSYFAEPHNRYFPTGRIDLRYGISASLTESKEKGRESRDFQITTDYRTYYFKADSSRSAKEWVKALQKVIFRTHNEHDSVKVSFPVKNIIDIEESPMVEFAETFKIRAVDAEDGVAIDEYYFTFFKSGHDAFDILKGLLGDTPTRGSPTGLSPRPNRATDSKRARGSQSRWSITSANRLQEPLSTSSRRRRSASTSLLGSEPHGTATSPRIRQQDSSGSFIQSIDQTTESSAVLQSVTDTTESASDILNRSDVFQSPTIHNLQQQSAGPVRSRRRNTDETTRSIAEHALDGLIRGGPETQDAISDSGQENKDVSRLTSALALNDLVRAGSLPLRGAVNIAEYVKSRSKEMSNLLATESMGYIEKVSGMWAGGGKHYDEVDGGPNERGLDLQTKEKDAERFRAHFALPPTEKLQAAYYVHLHRMFPLFGKIYLSQNRLCFRTLLPGTRTKMILPLKDLENVEKEKGFRFGYHGLVLIIRGHEELFFEFSDPGSRDDCAVTLHQRLEAVKFLAESALLTQQEKDDSEAAMQEHRMLQEARLDASSEQELRSALDESSEIQTIFDDPRASIVNFKPTESLRITCLTIGSRGDVQPYIALCKGFLAEGHKPKIATHAEFEPWIRKHGIDFAPVDGDPAELMRLCVENGMFTYSFLKEATAKFRGWIDDLLSSAWKSCQGSDILIESPSAMAGIHVAEALRIPYFRGFTMPWSRTRAYPHAFAVPEHRMGGAYNYISYMMFDTVFWQAISKQVNRWRAKELGLKSTNMDKMAPNKVPFLYNYSPSVVPPPLDYPDWIDITGYWFLNEGSDWTPPKELANFMKRARQDGKKIVYIGFGSIVVSDPAALTRTVIESVLKADVRCILSKGWSARLGDPSSAKAEIPLPPEIHQIQSAPHDWLFSHIDAAAHHGGAGTTGASLRAGVPTIVKPFFGDQFFFGNRVEDLGVGICMRKLNVSVFSRALWEVTHSERMIVKARNLGERIRNEDGVGVAIQTIYRNLEYARTLTQQRLIASSTPLSPTQGAKADTEDDFADIEDWTLIDDEAEPDTANRARDRAVSDANKSPEPFFSGSTHFVDSPK
ncbi:sterol 3-beta-glucosyltransferase [Aspergillus insuetus]